MSEFFQINHSISHPKLIQVDQIEYVEGIGNYSLVYLTGQKPILTAFTLKRFVEKLPNFIRIHKKTLVNPLYVEGCSVIERSVTLKTGLTLNVSRRRTDQLLPLCKL